MKQQAEEVFENAQKEIGLQTIDFIPIPRIEKNPHNKQNKCQENVNWKFNSIVNNHNYKPKDHKYTRNISFEDQGFETEQEEEDSREDYYRQSDFVDYYGQFQQVYRKKWGFGTSWIGRKQFYSSVFIEPSRIQKQNLSYFHSENPLSRDEVPPVKCGLDSDFQSGNLHSAFKVDQFQFDLLLQNDINTKGNTQWFYFRLSNPPKNKQIKINIVNLRKTDSLFNYGLMPCVYSMEENKKSKKGWQRGGKHIKYFKNNHQIQNSKRYYYTLTFTVSTSYEKDVILIAHSYPYTLSDLNLYLENLTKIKYKKELIERQTLVNTVGRNNVQVLTIRQKTIPNKQKPVIVVMARQHPGQTPASFVCQGLIEYFLSKDKESQYLRKNYEIKIIPMVNPDGVVVGNYRSNLSGYDLNRRWDGGNKSKNMHEASYIKKYLNQLSKSRQVVFLLDLHGHSRKLFSFFYGNPSTSNPIQPRIFPYLCSKLGPNMVRFEDSTFVIEQSKRNTARIQLYNSFKIPTVFTYETSFFGFINKNKQKQHFTTQSLRQLGQILGKSIFLHERGKELILSNPDHKDISLYKKCLNELKSNNGLISMGQKQNSGSESEPEECEVKEQQIGKLEQNEDYNKAKISHKVKIVKKVVKKEPPPKEIFKSLRQMQVMDVAQVYSAFPSNIIALIPTSFINKIKKPVQFSTSTTQTEDSPIIKIYQSCKDQDIVSSNPEQSAQFLPDEEVNLPAKKNQSHLLKSTMLNRPKTTNLDSEGRQFMSASLKTQRKSRDIRKRQSTQTSTKKPGSSLMKSKTQQKGVQTNFTFGKWNANQILSNGSVTQPKNYQRHPSHNSNLSTLGNWKLRLSNEADLLEYKSVDPQFSTINYGRGKSDSKSINRNLSKNIVQSLKIRRKNAN